jgi:mannose-1-phosphate guanylyltransferase / mannose-6-phosphate isomerase
VRSTKLTVQPVIMAGGSGSRLWPLSRAGYPKQFLVLSGTESLFQQATKRVAMLADASIEVAKPTVVANETHRFLVLEQLRELKIGADAVLLEPEGRNTAPALTMAALQALESGRDPVLVVTPADQIVADGTAYANTLRRSVQLASEGSIVILGIVPDRPETGFGYIRCAPGEAALNVVQFVEKPDATTAERYLAEGGYYWNSGMFVLKASVWMRALEHFRPDIAQATQAAWAAKTIDNGFVRPGQHEFAAVPAESVDCAVMERCPASGFSLCMLPLDAGWSDLGSWEAVWQVADKDRHGNASVGDSVVHDSQNTLVHATHRLVGLVGLSDVVVIETPDAVMVANRSRTQEVKSIVAALTASRRSEHTAHRQVHRPWGWYDSIDAGPRFQVKRIMVRCGAKLSLQMHHHRAEHWIVVSGTAEITCGDKTMLLTENQSTYIPLGQVHRLANPGAIPLEIIEVQSGSYLGEDDIVRFDDTYGRT